MESSPDDYLIISAIHFQQLPLKNAGTVILFYIAAFFINSRGAYFEKKKNLVGHLFAKPNHQNKCRIALD
jgi:hypothetical protein